MALWQISFYVLLNDSVESLGINYANPSNEFDDLVYWKFKKTDKSLFYDLEKILTPSNSWSNEILLFGNQESTCIEVVYDKESNYVNGVLLRLDFTTSYENTLRNVIDFLIIRDLILITNELKVLPLNFVNIEAYINDSAQVKKYREIIK